MSTSARTTRSALIRSDRHVLCACLNLLDIRNETDVYDDTGRAGFTTDEARVVLTNPRQRINSLC